MTVREPADAPGPGRVRRAVWIALAVALLCALGLPALTLWHASSAALAARACVWPAAPRLGQPAHLVVTLPQDADRGAVGGPGGALVADWDMVTMSMGARQTTVPGATARDGVFDLPVQLDMAGPWRFNVALRAPGRPEWRATLDVDVPSTPTAPPAPAPPAASAAAGCGAS